MADLKELKKQEPDNFTPFSYSVWVRGIQLKNSNINSINITESIFGVLPILELTFEDYGIFSDVLPLGDDDDVVVEISTHKDFKGIQATFSINDYHIIPSKGEATPSYYITITALLKNNNLLFPLRNRYFANAKSADVLSEIFEEAGFDVSNPTVSKDRMTWLQTEMTTWDMINNVVDYSYVGDNNILMAFVDKNSNAYIKDLISQTSKPKTFDLIRTPDPRMLYLFQLFSPEKKITNLGFNFWRHAFSHGTNNKKGGYGVRGFFYDFDNPKVYHKVFQKDLRPLTDYSLKSKANIKGGFSDSTVFPMRYSGSNVHDYYQIAYLQNKYIRHTMFSDLLIVTSYFNDEVKLLDKVNVKIPSLAIAGGKAEEINNIYSGEYLVVAINNMINKAGNYNSTLCLSRGGINKTAMADKSEITLSDGSSFRRT